MERPVEKAQQKIGDAAAEADRGKSERTPWLVLGGVHVVVFAFVAIVLALALTAYFVAG
ncbi:MAG TPA: hypothetical protein VIA10_14295 [Gaiellaceae bacterium]|jgi:hypothetical protein